MIPDFILATAKGDEPGVFLQRLPKNSENKEDKRLKADEETRFQGFKDLQMRTLYIKGQVRRGPTHDRKSEGQPTHD